MHVYRARESAYPQPTHAARLPVLVVLTSVVLGFDLLQAGASTRANSQQTARTINALKHQELDS